MGQDGGPSSAQESRESEALQPSEATSELLRLGQPMGVLLAWFAKWLPLLSISIYGLVYGGYVEFYDQLGMRPELVGLPQPS